MTQDIFTPIEGFIIASHKGERLQPDKDSQGFTIVFKNYRKPVLEVIDRNMQEIGQAIETGSRETEWTAEHLDRLTAIRKNPKLSPTKKVIAMDRECLRINGDEVYTIDQFKQCGGVVQLP